MSPSLTLFLCYGVAMAAVLIGIPVYDTLRNPITRPLPPPSANTTAPLPVYPNTTALTQACIDARCAPGGCLQSTIAGVTQCTNCTTGSTLNPQSNRCVDTTECALWPWCSTAESQVLRTRHDAVAAFNPTFGTIPVGWANVTTAFVPALGSTNFAATVRINEFYTAKRALLSQGSLANPTQFWNDEDASSSSLEVYKAVLMPEYKTYVTNMKFLFCTRKWQASQGQCIPPLAL